MVDSKVYRTVCLKMNTAGATWPGLFVVSSQLVRTQFHAIQKSVPYFLYLMASSEAGTGWGILFEALLRKVISLYLLSHIFLRFCDMSTKPC